MSTPLVAQEIVTRLKNLDGWCVSDDQRVLEKRYTFSTFPDAFAFMTRVAVICEHHDHHPDWCNTYNRVDVRLSSHDAGGLTERDFNLAQAMDDAL